MSRIPDVSTAELIYSRCPRQHSGHLADTCGHLHATHELGSLMRAYDSSGHPRLASGLLLASAGAIAFSGKAIIVKLSYRYEVDAVTVIMYRMLFALPLFLLLSWFASRGQRALRWPQWRMLLLLGFTGYYLSSFLDFLGLQYVSAGLERLILYLNPTIVLLLSAILLSAKVPPRRWLALAISYVGVAVAFWHDVSFGADDVVLGAVLVFASAVSYALYLVMSGEAVKQIGALRITGIATSIACILCVAQFFALKPVGELAVPAPVVWLSLLNATLCTFLPVLLVMVAIERIGASLASPAGMIGPPATILLGVVLLDEPFSPWMALGAALVLTGVWLVARWRG